MNYTNYTLPALSFMFSIVLLRAKDVGEGIVTIVDNEVAAE